MHWFHRKNTLGQYIKEAVTLKLLTEHEENQTISIYFPFPSFPFMHTDREALPRTAHKKQMNFAPTKAVW